MNYDEWKLQASLTPRQGRPPSKEKVRDPEDIVRAIKRHLEEVAAAKQ